ncbi:MAG: GH3 auxin-responsive promoter family protein, partial [Cyclobacteriaceae bacterium]
SLLKKAANTSFGKDHKFSTIKSYKEFKKLVPIQDYEGLRPYVERAVAGEKDVLWPGKPTYFAKTSGTTSGAKYIPLTKESIPYHIKSARNALFSYVHETKKVAFFDGKLIFLSGSPVLTEKNGVFLGRLSGIINHHIPAFFKKGQLPSYATNCIDDWEEKLDAIVKETIDQDMMLISGIPPWVQMYFDQLIAESGKPVAELFPNLSLLVHGGVNFEPYRPKLEQSVGKQIPTIETYPASEGFIAYQDSQKEKGLLLLLNHGIFYEFIPTDEYFNENPTRLSIEQVELGVNYAIILNTNAGLWGYSIGDTVKFVSKDPYRIMVTGRIKHFISAFGEHVIAEEVEKAMNATLEKFTAVKVIEFTVAPFVSSDEGASYHEWFIEFENIPINLGAFEEELDRQLTQQNTYYNDLISGNILRRLKVTPLKKGGFVEHMKSKGKLGGQNKVPRLSNDRKFVSGIC